MLLNRNVSDIFLMKKLGLWVFRRKTTEARYYFHTISIVHSINMMYHCWCSPWPPGWVPLRFLNSEVTHLFPYCTHWKEVVMHSSHEEWRVMFPSFTAEDLINYLEFYMADLLLLSPIYLLKHLLIVIGNHGYLFYPLSYNSILLYILNLSNCPFYSQ